MHPDCDPTHPAPRLHPHAPRHERHPAPAPRRQPSGRDGCLRRLPRTHRPAYVGRAVPPHGHTPGLPAPQRIAPASWGWMDGWLSRLLATPRIRGRAGGPEGRSMLRRCREARPKMPISLRTTVQVNKNDPNPTPNPHPGAACAAPPAAPLWRARRTPCPSRPCRGSPSSTRARTCPPCSRRRTAASATTYTRRPSKGCTHRTALLGAARRRRSAPSTPRRSALLGPRRCEVVPEKLHEACYFKWGGGCVL